jgi:hypothetical protein
MSLGVNLLRILYQVIFLSLHKIQIPMNLFVFIAIYILPSMLLAGIFAPKLGKLIQRLIEYLLNKISK